MNRIAAIALVGAVALCALPARGEQIVLTTTVKHAMTPIDSLPTKADLQKLFPLDTVNQLSAIAHDMDSDPGIRLRAIRALPQFCTTPCAGSSPHGSLVTLLATFSPSDQLDEAAVLLRATIEALGAAKSGDPLDVGRLTPFLDSPSRDIRAATAFALRDLCDQQAVAPLRSRYNTEMTSIGVPQVRLAISVALRDLGTCGN